MASQRIHAILEQLNTSDEHISLEVKKGSGVGKSILETINSFQQYALSDDQKLALIFVREVGAIDNSSYCQLTGAISLEAGIDLRDLLKKELLVQKGASKSTYYIAGKSLIPFLPTMVEGLSTQAESLSPQAEGLSTKAGLPEKLQHRISQLGNRTSNTKEIEQIIIELCDYKELTLTEIATLLGRHEKYIKNNYLKKLLKDGRIRYTIPEMISHPKQKYTAKTTD